MMKRRVGVYCKIFSVSRKEKDKEQNAKGI